MAPLEKTGIVVGIALPLLAAAWWAGSGYVEFSDRLKSLEQHAQRMDALADAARSRSQEFTRLYERQQAEDRLVNEQVRQLVKEIEWLKYHHHHEEGEGRPHVD